MTEDLLLRGAATALPAEAASIEPPPLRPLARTVAIVAGLSLATFLTALDNTIVNVALPTIQADLGLSRAGLEWVVSAYILSFAGLMFLGGRLSDRHDRRGVFAAGLLVFAVASLLAALGESTAALIAARSLQGLGAALLAPAALSIVGADLSPVARQVGTGVATVAAASALALGPVFGGLITEHWSWNGIFLVNVPVAVGCVALVFWGLSGTPTSAARGAERDLPLGLPGILSSGVALAALVWALIEAGPHGLASARVLGGIAVALAAAAVFVGLARTGRAAIVDRLLLRNRRFNGSAIASLLWGLGISGVFFFTSLYLQNVLGLRPVEAGATFVPLAVALVVSVALIAPLSSWVGSRLMVAIGLALVAGGLLWVSLVGEGASRGDLIPGLVVIGAGSGLTVPLTAIALEAVDASRMGMASSLLTAIREVSGAFGIAFVGLLVTTRERALVEAGQPERLAFLGGYELGLQVASALTLVGAVIAFVMLRGEESS